MNWLYYLLEANLYLAVFYGLYRLFLHKETFYTANRYYLIAATLLAFVLPFLQISYLYSFLNGHEDTNMTYTGVQSADVNQQFTINQLIIAAYLVVAMVFLIKLTINLTKIIKLTHKATRNRKGSIIHIELPGTETAFSFFNILFINPLIKEKEIILKHEMVHISQKHSLDILFFEFIQILNWFNPVSWFLKKDIKLLHEYIADDLTTNTNIQKHDYAMFLIQNSFGIVPNQLTNQIFNQSILKRRINMLNKERSTGRARLKLLFALPIAGGMICASTMAFTKDYAMIDLYPEKYEAVKAALQEPVKVEIIKKIPGKQVKAETIKKVRIKSGSKAKTVKGDVVKFPPPIVKKDQVKFPPPIIKPHKKGASTKNVKFPPPIVTPDKPVPPPPPPVEPAKDEAKSTSIRGNEINVVITKNGEQAKSIKGQEVSFTAKDGAKSTVNFIAKPTN